MMLTKRILLLSLTLLATAGAFAADTNVASSLESKGLLLTLAGIFLGGMLVSLTPCVYPMIPITLSIIGARSAQSKPLVGFMRSLVFVLGIASIYTALGLIVALSGGTIGFLLQSKGFLFGLSIFFIFMGLGMLGLFNLQLPPAIAGRLQGTGNKGGFLGAFLLGITTGVVASPCGSPVLFSIITLAGTSGNAVTGGIMLFTYALGIGMLFLVLGASPVFLGKMPKSGVWMEDVKKFLGIVLILAAFYYLKLALPEMLVWGMLIATCLFFAFIIAAKSQERAQSPALMWSWRLFAFALVGVVAWVTYKPIPYLMAEEAALKEKVRSQSLMATQRALPDGSAGGAATAGVPEFAAPPEEWIEDEAAALALAKEKGWPVMVDFTADWCTICKELDREVFENDEVKKVLSGFIKVKVDCTEDTPENTKLQEKYKSISKPTVAFVTPDGTIREELTLYEKETAEQFIERLKKVQP